MHAESSIPVPVCPRLELLEPRILLDGAHEAQAIQLLNISPALFIENQGQWADESVRYAFHGSGANVLYTDSGPVFQIFQRKQADDPGASDPFRDPLALPYEDLGAEDAVTRYAEFSVHFDGADAAVPVGLDQAGAVYNYYVGDEADWRTNVPAYEKVAYPGLYEGIDLHTWGRRNGLKYEFHVAPGADWTQIQVSYEGIAGLSIDADGALHVQTELGELVEDAPYIYQDIDGRRVEVAGAFALIDADTYAFAIHGPYEPAAELVIDPNLGWATYLGGADDDLGWDVAIDDQGYVWVAGDTKSSGFPVIGGFDTLFQGGREAFVARFSPSGGSLWSTFIGGEYGEWANGLALDDDGNVLVTGATQSGNFPTTPGAYDRTLNNPPGPEYDGFVAKLDPSGGLAWSTFLGGSLSDYGNDVAADSHGDVLVVGFTRSSNFPTPAGFDTVYNGDGDGFVAKLSAAGNQLIWASYVGGGAVDAADAVDVGPGDAVFVSGETESNDFPVTPGAEQAVFGGTRDAFVICGTASGQPQWSTYLGGDGWDQAHAMAVDEDGNVLIAGETSSSDFPATPGAHDTTLGGNRDAFVAKMAGSGQLAWGTYLGGSGGERGYGIAVDATGNAIVTGPTSSNDFPVPEGFDQDHNGGLMDAFVARLSVSGQLEVGSYLGGSDLDHGHAVHVDRYGNAALVGRTMSDDFPTTPGAWDETYNPGGFAGSDAFVALIMDLGEAALPDLFIESGDVVLEPHGDPPQQRVTATIHNIGHVPATAVEVVFTNVSDGTQVGDVQVIGSIGPGASAAVSVLWTPAATGGAIRVDVDPDSLIEEVSEANNYGLAAYGGAVPIVGAVVADWDADGDAYAFGRYVSDVALDNVFHAVVAHPDPWGEIQSVTFTLGPLGSQTDTDGTDGWTTSYDMGALSGDATLTVQAVDDGGKESAIWQGTVHVVDFPGWLGSPGTGDSFSTVDGYYRLTGFFPEGLQQSFTVNESIPILGGTQCGFEAGVQTIVIAPLWTWEEPTCSIEFVASVELFDWTVLDIRHPPEYSSDHFSVQLHNFDLDSDSLDMEAFDLTVALTDLPLWEYKTPEFPVFQIGIDPLASCSLSLSFGISTNFDGSLTLRFDGSGISVAEAELGFDVSSWGKVKGSCTILGLDIARVEIKPILDIGPVLRYDGNTGDWTSTIEGSFKIRWEAKLGICPYLCLKDDGWIPDSDGWPIFSIGAGAAGSSLGGTELILQLEGDDENPAIFPMLSANQDAAGNAIIVRTMDSDPAPETTNSDVYYIYRPAGGTWTALAPVVESPQMLTAPVVAMDGQGGAVAVWVANDLPADGSADPTPSELFQHQDLYGAHFDGTAWSDPIRITDDLHADGQPALACDPVTGNALLVWTRSEAADATDRSQFEIAYAAWDAATQTWSAPALLTSDAVSDWAPQVAFNNASQAMVVWARDVDLDCSTRELAYAEWDGTGWSAVGVSSDWARASDTTIAATPSGAFLVACVEETDTHEMLLTAIYDPTTHTWDAADVVADGGVIQAPRLRVNQSGVATLIWQAIGGDGQNDILGATRDLVGGGGWTAPRHMTDDSDIESMPVLLFDDAGDPYTAFEQELMAVPAGVVAHAAANGGPSLGADVGAAEADLVPDLAVSEVSVLVSRPVEGEDAHLKAAISNDGWIAAEETLVAFYVGDPDAGGTLIGTAKPVAPLEAGGSVQVESDLFSLPVGTNDYYAVVVPVLDETVLANNAEAAMLESFPPDVYGPQPELDLQRQDVLSGGTSVLRLQFDEPVAGVTAADVSLTEDTLGTIPVDHVYLAPDRRSAVVIVEGGLAAASEELTYTLRLSDSVQDVEGNPLDGDKDGAPSGAYEVPFTVALSGDANVDGTVNFADFQILQNHWNMTDQSFQTGDSNGDGVVDFADFQIMQNHWSQVAPIPESGGVPQGMQAAVAVASQGAAQSATDPSSEVLAAARREGSLRLLCGEDVRAAFDTALDQDITSSAEAIVERTAESRGAGPTKQVTAVSQPSEPQPTWFPVTADRPAGDSASLPETATELAPSMVSVLDLVDPLMQESLGAAGV